MKIVICVKPVKTELLYPNEVRNESYVMNPYDLHALNNCIKLKKETECHITCLSMGPMGTEYMLTKALAIGADEAILLNDRAFAGSDTVATTYVLSQALKQMGDVDMVVFGERSIDGETGQIVYGMSERLGYRCIDKVEIFERISDGDVILKRNDGSQMTTLKIKMPFVASFYDFDLTQPDVGLLSLKKARRKGIKVWTKKDILANENNCGLNGSKTKVLEIQNEFAKKQNNAVIGTSEDKAVFIFSLLGGEQWDIGLKPVEG